MIGASLTRIGHIARFADTLDRGVSLPMRKIQELPAEGSHVTGSLTSLCLANVCRASNMVTRAARSRWSMARPAGSLQ